MPMFAVTLSSAVLSVVAVVRNQAKSLRTWNEARRGYAELCEMDDRTLSDLGLTRSDLRDVSATGYFGDPTTALAARVAEREGRRRFARAVHLNGPSLVPDVDAALPRSVPCM